MLEKNQITINDKERQIPCAFSNDMLLKPHAAAVATKTVLSC